MSCIRRKKSIELNKNEPDEFEGYPSIPVGTKFQQELRVVDPRVLPIKLFVTGTAIPNEMYCQTVKFQFKVTIMNRLVMRPTRVFSLAKPKVAIVPIKVTLVNAITRKRRFVGIKLISVRFPNIWDKIQ